MNSKPTNQPPEGIESTVKSKEEILLGISPNYRKWTDKDYGSLYNVQINGFEVFAAMEEYAAQFASPPATVIQTLGMQNVKEDIANILRDNIHFSGQVGDYVIHGAIEKIIEYFKPQPLGIEAELEIRTIIHDINNGLKHPMVAITELIELFKAGYAASPQSSKVGLPKLDQPILNDDDVKGIIETQSSTSAEEKEVKQEFRKLISQLFGSGYPETFIQEIFSKYQIYKK